MGSEFLKRFQWSLKKSRLIMLLVIGFNVFFDLSQNRPINLAFYASFVGLWVMIGVVDAYVYGKSKLVQYGAGIIIACVFTVLIWYFKTQMG